MDKVTSSVARGNNAVKIETIYTARGAFRSVNKDVPPVFRQSNLIYEFQCCRDATYIGSTSQRLEVRVRWHVPRGILDRTTSRHSQMLNSAIDERLNAINTRTANYNDECFASLHRTRTKQHLNVLEPICILCNRPSLCKQYPRLSLQLLGDVSGLTKNVSFVFFLFLFWFCFLFFSLLLCRANIFLITPFLLNCRLHSWLLNVPRLYYLTNHRMKELLYYR